MGARAIDSGAMTSSPTLSSPQFTSSSRVGGTSIGALRTAPSPLSTPLLRRTGRLCKVVLGVRRSGVGASTNFAQSSGHI